MTFTNEQSHSYTRIYLQVPSNSLQVLGTDCTTISAERPFAIIII